MKLTWRGATAIFNTRKIYLEGATAKFNTRETYLEGTTAKFNTRETQKFSTFKVVSLIKTTQELFFSFPQTLQSVYLYITKRSRSIINNI